LAIYAALLQGIVVSDDIHEAVWGCAGMSALLIFTLFKTGSLAKSIFGAH
jgi:hypothetical protein